jgi:hypothetical protein
MYPKWQQQNPLTLKNHKITKVQLPHNIDPKTNPSKKNCNKPRSNFPNQKTKLSINYKKLNLTLHPIIKNYKNKYNYLMLSKNWKVNLKNLLIKN